MKYKLRKEQILSIPTLLDKYSARKIAKEYGVNSQTIYYHIRQMRKNGLYVKVLKGRRPVLNENDYKDLIKKNTNETDTKNQTGETEK